MGKYDKLLEELKAEEGSLLFTEFTNKTALKLGNILLGIASSEHLPVTIEITRNGQELFHYAFEGTTADNDRWAKGKAKVVGMYSHSSYYMEVLLKNEEKTLEEQCCLSSSEYLARGGAVPVFVKNVGLVGSVAVSGLASDEDHKLVVRAIRKYLEPAEQR